MNAYTPPADFRPHPTGYVRLDGSYDRGVIFADAARVARNRAKLYRSTFKAEIGKALREMWDRARMVRQMHPRFRAEFVAAFAGLSAATIASCRTDGPLPPR